MTNWIMDCENDDLHAPILEKEIRDFLAVETCTLHATGRILISHLHVHNFYLPTAERAVLLCMPTPSACQYPVAQIQTKP